MKYIILKAQEAREFEDLGGLTITKQFKPEPPYIEGAVLEQTDGGNWRLVDNTGRPIEGEDGAADVFVPPVQSGDVVYIREPWTRLKNPDGSPSDRIRLAADSVVSEGQQACKWSSPVSMPEDAARRFAVVGAVEPIYNKNIIIWQITLHAVTKEAAQEAEASGLPVPAAPVGESSDCDTYTGDVSGEDRERIANPIEIDEARERLTEVQASIIWLNYRRHGIEAVLKSGKANEKQKQELFNAGMQIAEEQKERIDEETELRRILESAGVQVLTTEEWAKERLAYIRARRAEIAEADQKTRVLEDLDGEDEILAADEMELNAYLDAAVTMAKSEPTEDSAELPDGEDGTETADDTDGAEEPPEEDEEDRAISVITKGLCKYCGQVVEVDPCTSQTEADETAAWVCKCAKASANRCMREQIADAQERVSRLFGDRAVDLGFKPIAGEGVIEVLERLVELIARGSISTAAINVRGQCMAKFSVTSKGKIKVSRSETRSCNLEAGE